MCSHLETWFLYHVSSVVTLGSVITLSQWLRIRPMKAFSFLFLCWWYTGLNLELDRNGVVNLPFPIITHRHPFVTWILELNGDVSSEFRDRASNNVEGILAGSNSMMNATGDVVE